MSWSTASLIKPISGQIVDRIVRQAPLPVMPKKRFCAPLSLRDCARLPLKPKGSDMAEISKTRISGWKARPRPGLWDIGNRCGCRPCKGQQPRTVCLFHAVGADRRAVGLGKHLRRRQAGTAAAFEFGQFGLRLALGIAPANLLQLPVHLGTVDLAADAGFGQRLLDRFAYLAERAQVLFVWKIFQSALDPRAGLRIAQARQHRDLLRLELVDLAFERHQVAFGLFSLR